MKTLTKDETLVRDLVEKNASSTQHLVLEPQLVVRASAAPPSR